MSFTTIELEVAERIATVTLNRPARLNAWTTKMQMELCEALDRCDEDERVRAVLVTGAGRAFCAGADLSAGAEVFELGSEEDGEIAPDPGGRFTLRAFDSRKPIIAAINGAAVGVGATMTLPMDIRLAASSARIGFVFTRIGLVPEAASSWFLPRIVGISRALEWTLTGRIFDAQEALEAGLVHSVHPAGELLDAARAIAAEIVTGTAPVSVAMSRRLLWDMLGATGPEVAHRADSRALQHRARSEDIREGVAAFLEKRSPRFPDRVDAGLPRLTPEPAAKKLGTDSPPEER